jgi:hypothetical protein
MAANSRFIDKPRNTPIKAEIIIILSIDLLLYFVASLYHIQALIARELKDISKNIVNFAYSHPNHAEGVHGIAQAYGIVPKECMASTRSVVYSEGF